MKSAASVRAYSVAVRRCYCCYPDRAVDEKARGWANPIQVLYIRTQHSYMDTQADSIRWAGLKGRCYKPRRIRDFDRKQAIATALRSDSST